MMATRFAKIKKLIVLALLADCSQVIVSLHDLFIQYTSLLMLLPNTSKIHNLRNRNVHCNYFETKLQGFWVWKDFTANG